VGAGIFCGGRRWDRSDDMVNGELVNAGMPPSMMIVAFGQRSHRVGMFYSMGMLSRFGEGRVFSRGSRCDPWAGSPRSRKTSWGAIWSCGWGGVMCCE